MKIDSFVYFYPEKPRLTSIKSDMFQRLSEDPFWLAERKYNGKRLQLHVLPLKPLDFPSTTYLPHTNGVFEREIQFWNRHGEQLPYQPSKEVIEALGNIPWPNGYCLFDGELRDKKVVGVRDKIVLWDVFVWDGELLTDKTFLQRAEIMHDAFGSITTDPSQPLSLSSWIIKDFGKAFEKVIQDPEIEGLVMKNLNGKLQLGRTAAVDSAWMWKCRKESGRYRF